MKKRTLTALMAGAMLLAGCGGGGSASLKDGTYEGKSEVFMNEEEDSEEGNGYGVVNITIQDGKISASLPRRQVPESLSWCRSWAQGNPGAAKVPR